MNEVEFHRMAEVEDTYWWHVGRRSIIGHQLHALPLPDQPRILNIGCGTGGMITILEQYGEVTNADVAHVAIDYCRRRGYERLVHVEGSRLPFEDGSFDIVVATDVLEHIKDEVATLDEWNRVLKPGGIALLTVPAYQWLWSEHDESLHHFRRYTASQVHRRLNDAGFDVVRRSYVITFSFPLVVAFRLLTGLSSRRTPGSSYVILPRAINWLFTSFLRIEARIVERVSLPFGTSVLAVGRKRGGRRFASLRGRNSRRVATAGAAPAGAELPVGRLRATDA